MNNKYEIRGSVTAIFLNRRDGSVLETIIDTADLDKTKSFNGKWYASWHPHTKSFSVAGDMRIDGKYKKLYLHRCLLEPEGAYVVDHINHETLDNRRCNLRIANIAENGQNRIGVQSNCKSGIRGVYWRDDRKKWQVHMKLNGKKMYFGLYETKEKAELIAKEARSHYMPFNTELV